MLTEPVEVFFARSGAIGTVASIWPGVSPLTSVLSA